MFQIEVRFTPLGSVAVFVNGKPVKRFELWREATAYAAALLRGSQPC